MQTVSAVEHEFKIAPSGERVQQRLCIAFQAQEMRVAPLRLVERFGRKDEGNHRNLRRLSVLRVEDMPDLKDARRRIETCKILQVRGTQSKAKIALIFGKRIQHFNGLERRLDAGTLQTFEYLGAVQCDG